MPLFLGTDFLIFISICVYLWALGAFNGKGIFSHE